YPDEQKLLLGNALLAHLLSLTQPSGIEGLAALEIRKVEHQLACDSPKWVVSDGQVHKVKDATRPQKAYGDYLPPVALAICLRSSYLQRRTAMAPASTKYFKLRSSTPLVVRMT